MPQCEFRFDVEAMGPRRDRCYVLVTAQRCTAFRFLGVGSRTNAFQIPALAGGAVWGASVASTCGRVSLSVEVVASLSADVGPLGSRCALGWTRAGCIRLLTAG